MNRYLLALLGLVAAFMLNSVIDGRGAVKRVTRSSRTAISANPTSAATLTASLEEAGRNVTRQTSIEGIERSRRLGTGTQSNTTPSGQFGSSGGSGSGGFGGSGGTGTTTVTPVNPVAPVTPVNPVTPAPNDPQQDAVPALW